MDLLHPNICYQAQGRVTHFARPAPALLAACHLTAPPPPQTRFSPYSRRVGDLALLLHLPPAVLYLVSEQPHLFRRLASSLSLLTGMNPIRNTPGGLNATWDAFTLELNAMLAISHRICATCESAYREGGAEKRAIRSALVGGGRMLAAEVVLWMGQAGGRSSTASRSLHFPLHRSLALFCTTLLHLGVEGWMGDLFQGCTGEQVSNPLPFLHLLT